MIVNCSLYGPSDEDWNLRPVFTRELYLTRIRFGKRGNSLYTEYAIRLSGVA